jgi:hypothetical protein
MFLELVHPISKFEILTVRISKTIETGAIKNPIEIVMENPVRIKNAEQLDAVLASAGGKVVFILHITKNSQVCRKALQGFESAAGNHEKAAVFGVVDQGSFDGESDYVTSVVTTPRIEAYFNGISCGGYETDDSKDIDRYVVSIIRNRGQRMGQQRGHGGPMASPNPKLPSPIEIQHKILGQARATNPVLFAQLNSNPNMLYGLVKREMDRLAEQNQRSIQQQHFGTMPPPVWTSSSVPPVPVDVPQSTAQQMVLPTLQQMQYMFEIFKNLQKMGVLDTSFPSPPETDGVDIDKAITLPDGRKIVPLGNDRYGLIEKE